MASPSSKQNTPTDQVKTALNIPDAQTRSHFLDLAFQAAREALRSQEVPVGCIFVHNGAVIARGRNTVNETKNATRHAEINCVDAVYELCCGAPATRVPAAADATAPDSTAMDATATDATDAAATDVAAAAASVPAAAASVPAAAASVPAAAASVSAAAVLAATDVYVTVEPCVMCAAALIHAGVRSVTYGCANPRFGGCGSVLDVPATLMPSCPVVFRREESRSQEAIQLLKQFYQGENPNVPK